MSREKIRLPRRSSKYTVGKEIGGAVYIHRDYEHLLGSCVTDAKRYLPAGFAYTVVKYSAGSGTVSFVNSSDFDSSHEPIVGDTWVVLLHGTVKFRKLPDDPYVYHHKWLMVGDDYGGFDVEQSKARSLSWMALPNFDRARIGRRSYWEQAVLPRLEPPCTASS